MPRRKAAQKGFPWYRRFNDSWYITNERGRPESLKRLDGSLVKGKDNEAEAIAVWKEMQVFANAPANRDSNPVRLVLDLYLQWLVKKGTNTETVKKYEVFFRSFLERWPNLMCSELRPHHLREWWDKDHKDWGETTRYLSASAFRSAFNWAKGGEGDLIDSNPLTGMHMPQRRSRGATAVVDPDLLKRFIDRLPEYFRDFVEVLFQTGTRPVNLCRAEARHLDEEQCALIFGAHNTDPGTKVHKTYEKTGKPLIIPLSDRSLEICKRLAERYPDGPLFRTKSGKRWESARVADHMHYYAESMGVAGEIYAYCARHTLASNLLKEGTPTAAITHIFGWRDDSMLYHHYGHIDQLAKQSREILNRHHQRQNGQGGGKN
jgi:integrase